MRTEAVGAVAFLFLVAISSLGITNVALDAIDYFVD